MKQNERKEQEGDRNHEALGFRGSPDGVWILQNRVVEGNDGVDNDKQIRFHPEKKGRGEFELETASDEEERSVSTGRCGAHKGEEEFQKAVRLGQGGREVRCN